MIGYLIDPFARTITAVETTGKLDNIYALTNCDILEAIRPSLSDGDIIYVDEEGKLREKKQAYFMCRLWPYGALAGKGLWLGTTSEGGHRDAQTNIEVVMANIAFHSL